MKGDHGIGLPRIDDRELFGGDRGEILPAATEEVCVGKVVGGILQADVRGQDVCESEKIGVCRDLCLKENIPFLIEVGPDAFLGKMSPCVQTPVTHVAVGEIRNDFLEDSQGFRHRPDAEEVVHAGLISGSFGRLFTGVAADQDRFRSGEGEAILDEVGVGIDEAEDLAGGPLEL